MPSADPIFGGPFRAPWVSSSGVFRRHERTFGDARSTVMTIPGYIDYQRREFCKDIRCPIQTQLDKAAAGSTDYDEIRGICQTRCIHTTYEFHHWLIQHKFEVARPE
jgi:hypothetical protein